MKQRSILVVDDSIATRNLIKLLLERAGYRVRVAEDGEQALYVLSQFHADLVLMDFVLPGMSGVELTTAYTLVSDVHGAQAAGCDAFIAKPIDSRTFVSQLEVYMKRLFPISRNGTPHAILSKAIEPPLACDS